METSKYSIGFQKTFLDDFTNLIKTANPVL